MGSCFQGTDFMRIHLFYGICFVLGLSFTLLSFVMAGIRPVRLQQRRRPSGWRGWTVAIMGKPFESLFAFIYSLFAAGSTGLFCLGALGTRDWCCHLVAGLSALAVAHLARLIEGFAMRTSGGGSDLKREFGHGHLAVAITEIPADSCGAVAYVAHGQRLTASARTGNGHSIRKNTEVLVVGFDGTTAIVEPTDDAVLAAL